MPINDNQDPVPTLKKSKKKKKECKLFPKILARTFKSAGKVQAFIFYFLDFTSYSLLLKTVIVCVVGGAQVGFLAPQRAENQ